MLIRYFAAARAAAGTDAETLDLPGESLSRGEVQDLLAARHPGSAPGQPSLGEVLARCSFLLDGIACPDPGTEVPATATLDVLPPFSGG